MIERIDMVDIVKQFPLVRAVDHVSFSIHAGEIHSLLGENGAGKTCLMKILYGMMKPDEGQILVDGQAVSFRSPRDSIALGIGMVHQHFMLSPVMTVTENIIAGAEPVKKRFFIDMDKAVSQVQELIDRYHFGIDALARVQDLSVGEQQRVEILKALYRGARILILDEPTAVLTPQEVDELFSIMRSLKESGAGIVIITHKLKETLAIADRISVLRFGKLVTHRQELGSATVEELAEMMVGRDVELNVSSEGKVDGPVCFEVENCTLTRNGLPVLKDISFNIRKGEILGIAGVEGNGQSELAEVLTGNLRADSLTMRKDGKEISGSTRTLMEEGIGHIPEDRLSMGLIVEKTISENLILGYHGGSQFCERGILKKKDIDSFASQAIKKYAIKTPDGNQKAASLSGGNQQKIVVARVIEEEPDILVVCQPTRGVDVGAMEFIHHQILGLRERGKAILLISADLDEVMNLSDRIAVMYEGRIVKTVDADSVTARELGLWMTGGGNNEE